MTITVRNFEINHRKITVKTAEDVGSLPEGAILKGDTTSNNRFEVLGADGNLLIISAKIPVSDFRIGTILTTV